MEMQMGMIRCPHQGCSLGTHPDGLKFCPQTGKLLPRGLKEKKRLIIYRFLILSLSISVIFLTALVISKGNKPEENNLDEQKRTDSISNNIFDPGETIVLKYQTETKGAQLLPAMVEAYLEKVGAFAIQQTRTNNEDIIVTGVIPNNNGPVLAEIHLQNAEKEERKTNTIGEPSKSNGKEKQQLQSEVEKRKKVEEECYNAYFTLAQRYYEDELWSEALVTINSAIKLKETDDADLLRQKIQKKEGKKVNDNVVNFLELTPKIKNEYAVKMAGIADIILPDGIKVTGEVNLILSVNKEGSVVVRKFIPDYMSVTPGNRIDTIKEIISEHIGKMHLPVPRDKNDIPVRVENWTLRYKVATFQGIAKLKNY